MAWHQHPFPADSSGRAFQVCYQDAQMSCTAASVAMAKYYVTGHRAPEAFGRFAIQVRANLVGQQGGMRDWQQYGASMNEVQGGIREAMLECTSHNPGNYFLSGRCTAHQPAICVIEWDAAGQAGGGGYHAVVCVGAVPGGANTIVVLDPWYGFQEIPIANLPAYHANGYAGSPGAGTTADGRFCQEEVHSLVTRGS